VDPGRPLLRRLRAARRLRILQPVKALTDGLALYGVQDLDVLSAERKPNAIDIRPPTQHDDSREQVQSPFRKLAP
jgi:hypothetical protein